MAGILDIALISVAIYFAAVYIFAGFAIAESLLTRRTPLKALLCIIFFVGFLLYFFLLLLGKILNFKKIWNWLDKEF